MWNAKSTQRISFVLLVASFAIAASGCQALEDRAGMALLGKFGGSCSSKGDWTEKAIAQNQAFRDVLAELAKTNQCSGFASQLTTISGLAESIKSGLGDPKVKKYLQNTSELADLFSAGLSPVGAAAGAGQAVCGASGPMCAAGSILLQSGFEKVVDIKKDKATASKDELQYEMFKNHAGDFVTKVQGMMSDMPKFRDCLKQSPVAAAQLAIQMLAVSGDASSPANGAGMGAAAQVMEFALESFSDSTKLANSEFEAQKSLMPAGLTCALESMTELYCQAQDATELLELQTKAYRTKLESERGDKMPANIEPVWRGMYILSHTLPVIAKTLREIRNGNKPSDSFDANRQNSVWAKVITLDSTYRDVIGAMGKLENLYNGALEPEMKKTYMKQTIREVSSMIDSSPVYTESLSPDQRLTACMLSKGGPDANCTIDPQRDGISGIEPYINNHGLANTTFENLRRNWELMVLRASKAVEQELALQIVIDPDMAIVSMLEPTVDNVSPVEAFELVDEFLEDLQKLRETNPDVDWNPELEREIQDTQQRLHVVIDSVHLASIDYTLNELDPKSRAQALIAKIYEAFQLRIGIQFLTERVRKFVEWDLNRRLKLGQFPSESAKIIAEMGGEVSERIGSNIDLEALKTDLDMARSTTQRNIQTFLNHFTASKFDNAFDSSMEMLHDAIEESKESQFSAKSPNRQVLSKLCILGLISYQGDSPRYQAPFSTSNTFSSGPGDFQKYCMDAVHKSVFSTEQEEEDSILDPHSVPLSLSYMRLYNLFSGVYRGRSGSKRPPLIGSADPDKETIYSQVFKSVIFSKPPEEEMMFERKVCTYHRFMRAGRIMSALPTLNPMFRDALINGPSTTGSHTGSSPIIKKIFKKMSK